MPGGPTNPTGRQTRGERIIGAARPLIGTRVYQTDKPAVRRIGKGMLKE